MIIRCGLLNWAVREAFLACRENLLLFCCTTPIPGTLVSQLAASTHRIEHLRWETMASCHLFFSFVCFFGFWSLSLSSLNCCCHHVPSAVQPGVREQGLGVAGREGRMQWCETVDAGWEVGTVPSPGDWGDSPPHFSSARPFLSATGNEGKEFEVHPPPSFPYVLSPTCTLTSPLAPHRCHLLCMWQRCECFCGGGGGACHKEGCPKSDYLHDLCDDWQI